MIGKSTKTKRAHCLRPTRLKVIYTIGAFLLLAGYTLTHPIISPGPICLIYCPDPATCPPCAQGTTVTSYDPLLVLLSFLIPLILYGTYSAVQDVKHRG